MTIIRQLAFGQRLDFFGVCNINVLDGLSSAGHQAITFGNLMGDGTFTLDRFIEFLTHTNFGPDAYHLDLSLFKHFLPAELYRNIPNNFTALELSLGDANRDDILTGRITEIKTPIGLEALYHTNITTLSFNFDAAQTTGKKFEQFLDELQLILFNAPSIRMLNFNFNHSQEVTPGDIEKTKAKVLVCLSDTSVEKIGFYANNYQLTNFTTMVLPPYNIIHLMAAVKGFYKRGVNESSHIRNMLSMSGMLNPQITEEDFAELLGQLNGRINQRNISWSNNHRLPGLRELLVKEHSLFQTAYKRQLFARRNENPEARESFDRQLGIVPVTKQSICNKL